MSLNDEILDALEDIKCPVMPAEDTPLTDLAAFSSIISWLSNQLQKVDPNFESTVHPIKDQSELSSFRIELNSLLREVDSPWIDCSLDEPKNKLSILNSICGEVLATRMNHMNAKTGSNQPMTISMHESQTAKDLKTILITLGMGRPPDNVTADILFKKIREKLIERLSQKKIVIEDSVLLPEGLTLSPDQWKTLEAINEDLKKDYTIRREMMLRRCDCTVNAFAWKSDNNEDIKRKISETYNKRRQELSATPAISLAEALSARPSDCDELVNSVVSKKPIRCMIQVPEHGMANQGKKQLEGQKQMEELRKYRIGSVPDRGGRPNEQPKPARETFNQQQFQRDNPQRGRGRGGGPNRGGGGGGRGGGGPPPNLPQNTGRVQGAGWANNTGDRYSGNYQNRDNYQSRDNYQQNKSQYSGGGGQYQQRGYQKNDYQQSSGYSQANAGYQQMPQNYNTNQYYAQQPYDNQYSNQSYYDNNAGHQQQRQQRGGYHSGHGGQGRRY